MVNNDKLRILWVKPGGLWPANTGGRLRSFNMIRELSRRHELTVLTTHHAGEDEQEHQRNMDFCKRVSSLPFNAPGRSSLKFLWVLLRSWFSKLPVDLYKYQVPALRQQIKDELDSGNYDLCIADFLVALPNMPEQEKVPVVFFSHNVEYMIWQRMCLHEKNLLRRGLLEIEWRKMRNYEQHACRNANLTVTVSRNDQQQLRELAPDCQITSIGTGVDLDYFKASTTTLSDISPRKPSIVFTGSMDWQPNEDAMFYFIEAILPLIKQNCPAAVLTIVGRNPSTRLRSVAERARVQVTGTVEDVRPYMESADVYVVPLRIGGGTRLKIFEALAMGKAIVSTTVGAEGLPVTDGTHLLLSDNPACFADKVSALLHNRQRRRNLGLAGRKLVEDQYSWASVSNEFEAFCQQALRPAAPVSSTIPLFSRKGLM